jgi:hypothetical protein
MAQHGPRGSKFGTFFVELYIFLRSEQAYALSRVWKHRPHQCFCPCSVAPPRGLPLDSSAAALPPPPKSPPFPLGMDPHVRWMVGVEARISAYLGLWDEEISQIITLLMPFCFPCPTSTTAPSSNATAVLVPSRDSYVSSNIYSIT